MTVRTAAAIASTALSLVVVGCTGFIEIPVETPIQAKIDVGSFQRVLVAGFLSGGSGAIDANTETARLLRSQLRTKQDLRVIDADAISLLEEVDKRQNRTAPTTPGPRIANEKDLESYNVIFKDAEFWKSVGAEYQGALIVTGSVLFTDIARSGVISRPQTTVNSQGIEEYRQVRTFADQKGYALTPRFVFIDGRTGAELFSEAYHEEMLYPSTQNTPALSSYFELMDKILPAFLNTLSTQKIRGSRVLLQ
jgi:hypothetical protein